MESLEKIAIKFTGWIGSIQSLIVHTIIFISSFIFVFIGAKLDTVLLVLTTALSLEAIYLAIFIQMTVNRNTQAIANAQKDIDSISEDVEEIAEDVEEIAEDVEEIAEDVEDIAEDMEGIESDIEDLQKDVHPVK